MYKKSKISKETATAFLFLTPNLLGFLFFVSLPILFSFILSFFQCDLLNTKEMLSWKFIGFANFKNLLGFHLTDGNIKANDPQFWKYLSNTFFLMLKVPFTILISLCLALLLDRKIRGISLFRTLFFLPTICVGTALYMSWRWIYNPDFGLINLILSKITNNSIVGPQWLTSPFWAKPSFIFMNMWTEMGGLNMILYLAALQNMPKQFHESAALDGAGLWARFRHITIPMLGPTTFFILIINIINGLQEGFQQAHIMTQGGPAGATTTLSYYIYNQAYVWNHMGYAAAIACILFLSTVVLSSISWVYGGKKVYYR